MMIYIRRPGSKVCFSSLEEPCRQYHLLLDLFSIWIRQTITIRILEKHRSTYQSHCNRNIVRPINHIVIETSFVADIPSVSRHILSSVCCVVCPPPLLLYLQSHCNQVEVYQSPACIYKTATIAYVSNPTHHHPPGRPRSLSRPCLQRQI